MNLSQNLIKIKSKTHHLNKFSRASMPPNTTQLAQAPKRVGPIPLENPAYINGSSVHVC